MRKRLTVAILALEFCAVSDARSQSRATLTPAVSISTVHDDNLFSQTRGVGDYMTQLRPFLEGTYESPSLNFLSEFSFDAQYSARHKALNAVDARRHALIDTQVRSTASILLGIVARYDRTETPGELNLDTAILLDRQEATRWQLTPMVTYRATPRTTFTMQYDGTKETLSGFRGGDLHIARLGVSRQLSARTTLSGRYLGRLFVDPLDRHQSHAALAGWSREMAPGTNLSVQAGPRVRSYGGVTSEVLAAFLRRTPAHRFLLDYWHGETIVLGIPGPVQVQSGTNKITWFLRRNLEVGTHVGAFRSRTLEQTQAIVYHGSVIGSWRPRDPYTITVNYGADFQKGDIRSPRLADERVRRGVFIVRLTIAPRLSRAFKPEEDPKEPMTPMKGVLQ